MNVHSECPQMVYADRFRVDDGDVSIQTTCQPSEAVLREIHEVAAPGTEGPSTPGVASDSPPNSVYCPQLFCGLTLSLFHRGRGNVSTPIGGAGRWEPLASVLPAHTVPRADRGPLIAAVRVFVAGVPALLASAEDHREVVVRQGLRPQREIGDGERWVLRRCHGIKRESVWCHLARSCPKGDPGHGRRPRRISRTPRPSGRSQSPRSCSHIGSRNSPRRTCRCHLRRYIRRRRTARLRDPEPWGEAGGRGGQAWQHGGQTGRQGIGEHIGAA